MALFFISLHVPAYLTSLTSKHSAQPTGRAAPGGYLCSACSAAAHHIRTPAVALVAAAGGQSLEEAAGDMDIQPEEGTPDSQAEISVGRGIAWDRNLLGKLPGVGGRDRYCSEDIQRRKTAWGAWNSASREDWRYTEARWGAGNPERHLVEKLAREPEAVWLLTCCVGVEID